VDGCPDGDGGTGVLNVSAVRLERFYRVALNMPDQLLHRRRHLAARRQLAGLSFPRSILVVCHGNICRSPYLEAVLRRALPDVGISSAGFLGPGRYVPDPLQSESAKRGYDLSEFRSRPLDPRRIRDIDLVVVMDSRQSDHLNRYLGVPSERILIAGDLDPLPSPTRAIQDPFLQPLHVVVSSLDRLDRCARTLIACLSQRKPR
jgi:protein-tyrosine phosphatase